jgi:NTE family protein
MTAPETLRSWLGREPFTLGLSSGFFSFFAHGGVLDALVEESLVPAALSGSSAGALTAGLWAAGLEPAEIRRLYLGLRKKDFWDPGFGPGLLRGRRFRRLIRSVAPVQRLEHCRTRLSVSAFDLLRFRTRVMIDGDLARSLYASCAVPGMFHPLWHEGGLLVDGGVRDRPGLRGVSPEERVFYHHVMPRPTWPGKKSAFQGLPKRTNLMAFLIPGLPRPGPDALQTGPAAWAVAKEATLRALDRPVTPGPGVLGVAPPACPVNP